MTARLSSKSPSRYDINIVSARSTSDYQKILEEMKFRAENLHKIRGNNETFHPKLNEKSVEIAKNMVRNIIENFFSFLNFTLLKNI